PAADPGPHIQRRWLALLSPCEERHSSHVVAGVFRRKHLRQRQGHSIPGSGTAQISLPPGQRLVLTLLSPDARARRRLGQAERSPRRRAAIHPDWHRRRPVARARSPALPDLLARRTL